MRSRGSLVAWESILAFFNPRIDRFVAAFFVGTLIFCHGVFGAFHVVTSAAAVSPTPAGDHAAAHHSSDAPGGAVPEEHPAPHHANAEYFAVLIGTFLGGLAICQLLRNDGQRDRVFSARRFVGAPLATVFNLPRGPTLTFLQVLRL